MIYRILYIGSMNVIAVGLVTFFLNPDHGVSVTLLGVGLNIIAEVNKEILIDLSETISIQARWMLRKIRKK